MSEVGEPSRHSIAVTREPTFRGVPTDPWRVIAGKKRFFHEPIFHNQSERVSVWRQRTADNSHGNTWRGSIDIEYSHAVATQWMLENLFVLKSQEADTPGAGLTTYIYRPRRVQTDLTGVSLRLAVDYTDEGKYYVYKGVMITAARFSVEQKRLVQLRYDWVASERVEMMSATGGTSIVHQPLTHLASSIDISDVAQDLATEVNYTFSRPITLGNVNRAGAAQTFKESPLEFSAEMPLYLSNDMTLPDAFASQAEVKLEIGINAGGNKAINLLWPRAKLKAGQPEAVTKGQDIVYRPTFEGLNDEILDPDNEPQLTIIL